MELLREDCAFSPQSVAFKKLGDMRQCGTNKTTEASQKRRKDSVLDDSAANITTACLRPRDGRKFITR